MFFFFISLNPIFWKIASAYLPNILLSFLFLSYFYFPNHALFSECSYKTASILCLLLFWPSSSENNDCFPFSFGHFPLTDVFFCFAVVGWLVGWIFFVFLMCAVFLSNHWTLCSYVRLRTKQRLEALSTADRDYWWPSRDDMLSHLLIEPSSQHLYIFPPASSLFLGKREKPGGCQVLSRVRGRRSVCVNLVVGPSWQDLGLSNPSSKNG